jgi:acyl-coenzyme A thioesterase PaaI-like protein
MNTTIQEGTCRDPRRKCASLNPRCVVCGAENANGLRLHFTVDHAGAHAIWMPTQDWESFEKTVHGGIVGAVLDEAMSKAVIAREWEALTAELRVRFRKRIVPGEELRVQGWVVARKRRHIRAEAIITSGTEERAHAWGTFLVPDEYARGDYEHGTSDS